MSRGQAALPARYPASLRRTPAPLPTLALMGLAAARAEPPPHVMDQAKVATETLFMSPDHPSRTVLPIIPR